MQNNLKRRDITIEEGSIDSASLLKEELLRQRILEMTSSWLSKVLASDKFLRLLGNSLSTIDFISHAVVLVYDRERNSYLVKMTAGSRKIPKSLLKLQSSSALIKDLSIKLNLEKCSVDAREEMKRFGAEMCFPIFVKDELTGILLVGPRVDGKKHNRGTIRFFKTLTNEIGVQFQKECFYIESITDPLTGLYNRSYLETKLSDLFLGKQKTEGGRIALALIDVDHFKIINDRLGHPAGDQALRIIAEKIKHSVREADLCFRYGGEEFCVLFCDLVRRDGTILKSTSDEYVKTILKLIERIKDTIGKNTISWKNHKISVTVSVGVSFLSLGSKDYSIERLIHEADDMLYAAKRAGRNQILVRQNLI